MTVSEQANALQNLLDTWASQMGGEAIIVPTLAKLWDPQFISQTKPRILIAYNGENIRSRYGVPDNATAALGRVDRHWVVAVTRGRSWARRVGDGLSTTVQNAVPLYDVIEELRDLLRAMTQISDELPVDFEAIRPMPSMQTGQLYLDAFLVEFSTGVQLPLLSSDGSQAGGGGIGGPGPGGGSGPIGQETPTIDMLPPASAALFTNEFAAFDLSWNPTTQRVNGTQLKALIHPANEISTFPNSSIDNTGTFDAMEFVVWNPNSGPPANFNVNWGQIRGTVGNAITADINTFRNVSKNAFLEASFAASPNGSGVAFTTATGFEQVVLSTLAGYSLIDPGGNFDAINNWYVVPTSGYYQIVVKFRICDGVNQSGSYGISAGLSLSDGPDFFWQQAATSRNGACTVITNHYTAGDHIMMMDYTDSSSDINSGSLGIQLLSYD